MKMKKTTCGVLAVAAVMAAAGAASAQVCAGFPTRDNQGEIHGLANFPPEVDQFGVEGSFNLRGPLSLSGGILFASDNDDDLTTFRAGAAFDITPYIAAASPSLSICPNVRADFASQGDVDLIQVPIGLGLGATLPLGDQSLTLTPFVIPAVVITRFSIDDPILGEGSETETDFGIRGGADVNFDRFFLGGTVEWIDNPGADPVFGVRAGIKF